MAITSKLRRHKLMERTLRALMGNNIPTRFKFKDTYDSIEVPTASQQHLPTQEEIETKFAELEVEEEAVIAREASNVTVISKTDSAITSNLEVGTSNLFVDTQTGRVGVGTTTPSYPLHVIGNIYGTGNITAYSDKRAKSDIVKIENALDKIDQLNGYTYTMNDERYTGLIAQEVLPVLPEAVVGSEETSYAIAYGNMMGLVIEAIKELNCKVEKLENKIYN
jgi:hypothetical protein